MISYPAQPDAPLPMPLARLIKPFKHKGGLTRFLPANVTCGEVEPVDCKGSGDIPSLARANAYLIANADQREYAVGDLIPVLLK